MSRSFSFKKFTINDHGCGMPISTDGVLLGAWATLPQQGHIVDIGTGSGLLALMAAQRTQATTITAIELDSTAATAATANFESSPWRPRLQCVEDDITNWYQRIPPASINGIICNPPYFNAGQQAQQQHRATARHTDTFSHQQLLATISHLLTTDGSANIILPTYEGLQLITQAQAYGLYCHRRCDVRTTEHKPIMRTLIQLTKNCSVTEQQQLCIHTGNSYSTDFIALTKDFYLKM
ncbi:tRNA1(Val) (adenine(37)-N6)-methyltransferase [Photobacterium kishitanii]|uniref:tRNA1(Val) (adenine(37)-N6)-methyltransferase n=1 Tax=Photobacterium kishitanii TaxID=318456 RepID=UPI0007F8F099|nr:methyltransferase [Photobacterium kishitanii]OBU25276.1 SAM-dependent methyltransferase [Photobacterium kishitanii]PSW48455.1 methyltransferase domain-containing protein [Photobacterium kishitanii]